MQLRYIFALCISAVLAGWIMPGGILLEPASNAPLMQAQIEPDAALIPEEDPQESEGISLTRQPDGHFYANAAVSAEAGAEMSGETNESEVRFLVDTGASGIALTGADAEALGLSWDENELQKVGRGVSGDVYGKPVLLKSVQVGEFIVNDVQAAIIPEGLDVSLLGQSFLSKVGSVNIQGSQMTFN